MEEYKVKFMCSYGGEVQPRPHDNHLSYIGGHTKILYVHRSINFPALLAELSALSAAPSVSFKYQLPGEDGLDALISVTDDNDLHNMMLEYDHLHHVSPTRARLRLFLFPNNPPSNTFTASDLKPNHPIEVQQMQRVVDRASSFPEKYDVFISFRGEDTRTKFTCHLHEALSRKQIKTFIDYELHKGDEISPALFRAIENSYVSVVVFSENYASSKWCLEELVKILECRKERGQDVVPVFYDIDPSHVRKQDGRYKDAFEKHMQNFMLNMNKVKKWKEALSEAANLVGWDSHSRSYRDDSILIQKIVKEVSQRLTCHYSPNDFKSLVGIDKSSAPLESLLREAQSVGIWGMGGIGKTTIARDIFHKYFDLYEGSCFLENVRERSGKRGEGLNNLHNQLHSKLLNEKICQDSTDKSTFIECRLHRQRNFIVLDDVSSSKQLEYLIGDLQSFGLGSKIIITTRDKSVLENRKVEKIHQVKELDFQESLKLFSLNAFNEDRPKMGYKELSQRAIAYCKGIPLALIVLGSFLHCKTEIEWDSALKRLEKIPDEDIQNVLQLSYDGLTHEEKQIFLDIAFYLKGQRKEDVVNVLDSCGLYVVIGMRSLLDKALITIFDNSVWMHDLIQHMGWEIVRRESIENPENRSRLWDFYDTLDVLENNKGTDAIRGLLLDTSQSQQDLSLGADTFKKMPSLRYLIISSCHGRRLCNLQFPMGLESFPAKLRYLKWDGYPLQSLPSNFCPEKLVTLSMPNGQFKRLWGGVQNLGNLKEVNLEGCRELIELPDFSKAQNLIKVELFDCISLHHVHPSILSLGTLECLDLQDCKKLEALESEIHFKSLWYLCTEGCSSLRKFSVSSDKIEFLTLTGGVEGLPSSIGRCSKLKKIHVDGCRLENLPKEFSCLKSLEELSFYGGGGAISKQNLDGLQSLQKLWLHHCHDLFELPSNVCRLSSLQSLVLDGSPVERLPESIKHLSKLERLSLMNCRRLKSLPELPSSIIDLDALNCTMLQTVASNLTNSRPQEHEHRSISFQNPVNLDVEQCTHSFHQYIRELAHGYELRYRGGGGATRWGNTFSICYPNHKVPEWFTYRTKGASITFELAQPSHQNFGFLLCIVLSVYWPPSLHYGGLNIDYRCYLENGDIGRKYSCTGIFLHHIPREQDSVHVYMSFHRGDILEAIKTDRVNHQSNPKVTLEFYGHVYGKQWKPDKDKLIKECGVYPLNASNCCIKEMELELGMKNKRLREILQLDHSENGVQIGSSDDQGLLPATKKLKEFC